jgi:hypothetical protein
MIGFRIFLEYLYGPVAASKARLLLLQHAVQRKYPGLLCTSTSQYIRNLKGLSHEEDWAFDYINI